MQELREAVRGERAARRRRGLRGGVPRSGTACTTSAAGADRPLHRRGRRHRRGRVRAQQGPPIAVRGGGHSIAGFSTGDGGDRHRPLADARRACRHRRAARVRRRRRRVGGRRPRDAGARPRDDGRPRLDDGRRGLHARRRHRLADAQARARAATTSSAPTSSRPTAGWFMRARRRTPTCFWGLRGGGGNFGIVTQFELALHRVGPMVYAGPIFYPAEAAGDLLRLFRDWAPDAPDDITALVNLTTAPPLPVIPEAWHGRKVAALSRPPPARREGERARRSRSARSPSRSPTCSARCRTR